MIFVTSGCYHGTVLLFSAVPSFLLYSFHYQGHIKVTSDHSVIEGRRKREIGGERANCSSDTFEQLAWEPWHSKSEFSSHFSCYLCPPRSLQNALLQLGAMLPLQY